VEAAILAPRYHFSRALGPGVRVDLNERVAPGVTLRDFVREEWFAVEEEGASDGIADRA
jgi:hypothetical protein